MERMLDCQKISDYLKLNGWQPASSSRKADLVIISTCAFGREEDASSLEYIHFFRQHKCPEARLVVVGCLSVINPVKLSGLDDVHALSPMTLARIEGIVPPVRVKFADVPEPNKIMAREVIYSILFKKMLRWRSAWRRAFNDVRSVFDILKLGVVAVKEGVRQLSIMKANINPFLACDRNAFYYLRVSKGCLGSCSYCAKKFSTGNLRSKPLAQVIGEFKAGLEAGERRFYLLTEDAGCYGMDQQMNVVDLLRGIFEAGDRHDFKIVISNLNARWFVKYYEALEPLLVACQDKIIHLQVPVQSGSSRILQRMDRHYSSEDVQEKLLCLRAKAPKIAFTTDIIAGFPGETDADLELTKELLSKIRFQHVDIFGYEKRPDTRAAALDGDVPPDEVRQRVLELACLQNNIVRSAPILRKLFNVAKENLQRYRLKSS
jgi:tRNA A37 methylthiotransferase MiaB